MIDLKTTFPFDPQEKLPRTGVAGLFHLLTGYRLRYGAAIVLLAGGMSAKTVTYLLLRYFVDNVLVEAHTGGWYALVACGFVGLAVVQGAGTFLSGRLAAQSSEGIIRRLRNYLFHHMQSLSFSYHDSTNTGELIQRSTSDVDTLRRFYSEQAIGLGRVLLLFAVNFVAIVSISLKLALVSVIAIPILVAVSAVFFMQISKRYEAFQKQEAKLTTTLQENLTGVRVVKAFARQEFERAKFDEDNAEKFRRGRRLVFMHSAFWPVTDAVCGLQLLGGYVMGAFMAISGVITLGSYLAYAGLIIWIIFPMRMLGRLIVETSKARVSYGRVLDIIKEEPEDMQAGAAVAPEDVRGGLVFRQVCFEYSKDSPVLHDVDLECLPGSVVALLGPTGSGKTTLVNLLPRFYEPSSGTIELDGRDLSSYSKESLRRIIGTVEQEPFLFSLPIAENISYGVGREVSRGEVEEAARAAAIHSSIEGFPEGYDTLVGEKGVTLSGGQKQRVAIARALLKDPRILILDDSTSSVDTETEQSIRQALTRLMRGRTTFIIAHRIQSLMRADLICVLDGGRIVQRGTHETLSQEDGIYRRIYEMQSRIDRELQKELEGV